MLYFWKGDGTEIMSPGTSGPPGTYGTQGTYNCKLDRSYTICRLAALFT